MIKQLLIIKKYSFDELYNFLKADHIKESLKIELDFLISIGAINLIKGNYNYKKKIVKNQ